MKRLHLLRTIGCGLVTLCLAVGCTQDELTDNTLPEGKYPLVLQGNLQPATRSTATNSWAGGELIRVRLAEVSDDVINSGVVEHVDYIYTADASGNLTSANPYYWQCERLVAYGYYPTDLANGSEKTMPTDQSTDEGFQDADVLYAPRKFFQYGAEPYCLDFYHQNVKLVVNVIDAGIVASDVSLSVGPIGYMGTYQGFNETGFTAGSWSVRQETAAITPHRLTTQNAVDGRSAIASFEVIVLPQTVAAGSTLFTFTSGGNTYTYEAPDGGITWETGKKYTYNVTIAGEGKVTVSNVTVSPWTENEEDIPLETE